VSEYKTLEVPTSTRVIVRGT